MTDEAITQARDIVNLVTKLGARLAVTRHTAVRVAQHTRLRWRKLSQPRKPLVVVAPTPTFTLTLVGDTPYRPRRVSGRPPPVMVDREPEGPVNYPIVQDRERQARAEAETCRFVSRRS